MEYPKIDGRYVRERAVAWDGATITYAGRETRADGSVSRATITEFFPVDVVKRGTGGQVLANDGDEECFERARNAFASMAQALRSLRHPNLLTPVEVFTEQGTTYTASPFVETRPLHVFWAAQSRDADELLRTIIDCLGTVEALHRAGFIHGNINRHTLHYTDMGALVVGGFGTWRHGLGDDLQRLPCTLRVDGGAVETYIPGEMEVGPWTDVYGLATVAYELAYGQPPAAPSSITGSGNAPPPGFPLPGHFAVALDEALRPHPLERPQSTNEWRAMLLDRSVDPGVRRAPPRPEAKTSPPPPASNQRENKPKGVVAVLGNMASVVAVVCLAALATIGIGSSAQRFYRQVPAEPAPSHNAAIAPTSRDANVAPTDEVSISKSGIDKPEANKSDSGPASSGDDSADPWFLTRMSRDRDRLRQQTPRHRTVLVTASARARQAQNDWLALSTNLDLDQMWVHQAKSGDYEILYGSFETEREARQEIARLGARLSGFTPQLRALPTGG